MKFLMILVTMMFMNNKTNKMGMITIILMMNFSLQKYTVSKMSFLFMGDMISYWITNMTMLVMYTLMFMKTQNSKTYFMIMNLTTITLTMTFYNWNFVMFYTLFEMSMIMILLIIMSWGYQPERTDAMMFMIVMTLMFSMPMMMTMMMEHKNMSFWYIKLNESVLMYLSFIAVFMMKLPSYFIHFWLPKAHVEAPVQGSMILAAIMLKLGCYGILRMDKMMVKFTPISIYLFGVITWSSVLLSMKCIMQIDLKTMIAYSSIVHMTVVLMNILLMKPKSVFSSMLIIIGHGLCSSSLFFMANMMYENSKSRSVLLNKGIVTSTAGIMLMWFISCMNNAPMPPSMNMMGELLSFKNMVNWSNKMYTALFIVALTSSMYSIFMFCMPSHGKASKTINKMNMNMSKNLLLTSMQTAPIMLIMIKPTMMSM